MNAERLLKLADHLENGKLGHKKFDFSAYHADEFGHYYKEPENCGHLGCAIGECPVVFPEDWGFGLDCGLDYVPLLLNGEGFGDPELSSMNFFGLTWEEHMHLFNPCAQDTDAYGGVDLAGDATKEQVASNIRAFVAKKQGVTA